MSPSTWETRQILITVKAYPRPSRTHGETECVAGVTAEGEWIRLYPVRWRDLDDPHRFKKWNWIEARVTKSTKDPRTETYVPDHDSIRVVGEVGTGPSKDWAERKRIVLPLKSPSLEMLRASDRSLGLIKVKELEEFILEPDDADWSEEQKRSLSRIDLFGRPKKPLEKVPWRFQYRFRCEGVDCRGHAAHAVDWELFQSWRSWRHKYKPGELEMQLRRKYFDEMKQRDLHFFMGTTLARHVERTFIIVGLFYPPK